MGRSDETEYWPVPEQCKAGPRHRSQLVTRGGPRQNSAVWKGEFVPDAELRRRRIAMRDDAADDDLDDQVGAAGPYILLSMLVASPLRRLGSRGSRAGGDLPSNIRQSVSTAVDVRSSVWVIVLLGHNRASCVEVDLSALSQSSARDPLVTQILKTDDQRSQSCA